MSTPDSSAVHSYEVSTEDVPVPGIAHTDTLPEIGDAHALGLSQLQCSDGDFHTRAKVGGGLFLFRAGDSATNIFF